MVETPLLEYRAAEALRKSPAVFWGWLSIGLAAALVPLWFAGNFWLLLINWTFVVIAGMRALELSQRRSVPASIAIALALLIYLVCALIAVIGAQITD